MNSDRFKELLAELVGIRHEMPGVECKAPGPRIDRLLQVKVIKAMLGMANRRDGGSVVVGVEEDKDRLLIPVGLSSADLATWKYDDLANSVAEYADPSISFEMKSHECDGKKYVLITVKEFEDVPIVCKKNYDSDLRKGACYVRSRRKPETTEIPTQEDMRDLLDLAAEKRLRKFIAQAKSAGLDITAENEVSDKDLFDQELGDFYRG
jgi:predicted HTH transcriptional regulator